MLAYDPRNWFWLADDGRVFASARQAIVDTTDAAFKAAQVVGGVTRWPVDETGTQTDAALHDVVAPYGLNVSGFVAVPASVHAYQFAGQAAAETIITADEGRAWAGAGTVPPSLQAAVDKLVTDPTAHDRVTFFLVGATEFPRYHPNTVALGAVFGKDTPAKLDAFFVAAGQR